MGRFESNALAPRHRHRPPRHSRSGWETLRFSCRVQVCKQRTNTQIRFFSERSRTPTDSFISKNEGMAKGDWSIREYRKLVLPEPVPPLTLQCSRQSCGLT